MIDKYLKKAQDIVGNWALAHGYTEVTCELKELADDFAEAIRGCVVEARDAASPFTGPAKEENLKPPLIGRNPERLE